MTDDDDIDMDFENELRELQQPRRYTRRKQRRLDVERNKKRRWTLHYLSQLARRFPLITSESTKHFDRDGSPMSYARWFWLKHCTPGYKRVALTRATDKVWVSTIWLGEISAFRFSDPPLIFESMIWHGPLHTYSDQYATEAEARAGHEAMLEFARAGKLPDELELQA